MTVYEQSDGLVPNKQTPPATSKIGASDALWSEVNAVAVSGTTINAGAINILSRAVPSYFSEVVDLVALTDKTITHNLNNSNPLIMVYGSGTNEVLHMGSGAGTIIHTASGATADTVVLNATAGAPGSTVVIIG